ncbi:MULTISPECIES: hypothetical protein [Paraburkholderia]|uniref:hypothetical protein n=1 Tax=Paraburkholderia TaxID=1822464 RepID=UPI001CC6167E|nr:MULTISPECIES: hypothetical protein [Paraburkholderia]
MRRLYFAAVFSVLFSALVSGCASNSPPASGPAGSQPPRLTVGTSYPDTQLILPWFLNDVINFVNYR